MEINTPAGTVRREQKLNFFGSCNEKCVSFWNFIYDRNGNLFCGKTPMSWASLFCFYLLFFFIVLILTFALNYMIIYIIYDKHTPQLSKMHSLKSKETLGLSAQPVSVESVNIILGTEKYLHFYNDLIDKKFDDYRNIDEFLYDDCLHNKGSEKNCKFDFTTLGPCSKPPYGYSTDSEPCIYIRLNRVVDFVPIPYKKSKLPKSMPEQLKKKIKEVEGDDYIWIWCNGERPVDDFHIKNISYYPQPGLPIKNYFPYKIGKPYLSPIVAVQINNITRNIATLLICHAWAENLPSDTETSMQIIIY